MNSNALHNIEFLSLLNENDKFSFNEYKLVKDEKGTGEPITTEYGLYFTFHEIFTLIDSNTRDRDNILIDLNNSIDNLYENLFFLNMIDNNSNIKEIMEEICTKVDILTEKYLNKSFCNIMFDELWRQYLNIIKSITINNRRNNSRVILSDESDNEDDFVKED
tara:strand:- start:13 stop:501 length:489 start_codon:yes stop_codon:yes gene_type:complete